MVDRSETFVKGRGEKNFRPPPFSRGGGYGTLTPGDYIMIRIQNIPLPIGGDLELLRRRAGKALGVRPGAIEDLVLVRQSIDARKKQDVHYVYTVDVSLKSGEEQAVERAGKKNIALVTPKPYVFPEVKRRSGTMPVVVGMGPAGLFAALFLARNGIPSVVLERGEDVDARTAKVEGFWAGGALDPASNVQFGEGGAGTFSDGKLTTGTHDPRISAVMDALVGAGAPADVKWSHKPHIGTDILRQVVKRIRQELIALGCDVRFGHQLTGLETGEGMLTGVRVEGPKGAYRLDCDALVLAPGHSARDTFAMLHGAGVPMEQKPFAIGVRIEQDQAAVSRAQYGPSWEQLPPSDYKLACHLPTGRSAFTFCVCPGGEVVAAASAPGQVVTNGMSYRARDGKNINGGFLVGVGPEDFSAFGSDPLAGVRFQEQWEHAAFQLGGGNFPGRGALPGAVGARGLSAGGRELFCPRPAGGGLPLKKTFSGAGEHPAHLPPRGDLDGAGPVSAPGGGRYLAGGPAPDGPEAPGLCLPGRGAHRSGDPLLLAGAHPPGRDPPVRPSGALSLRRRGRVCGRNCVRCSGWYSGCRGHRQGVILFLGI